MIIDSALSATSTHPVENKVITKELANKVNKEEGKVLSSNDFTDNNKTKLDSIQKGAQINVIEKIMVNGEEQTIKDKTVNIEVTGGGGGGSSADYDSLPVGSIINFDGNEVPVGYEEAPDDIEYSIEEKVVGTYVDGKPIYQKTFTGTYSNGATLLSNVDKMIRVEGQVFIGDMYRLVPYYEVYNGQNYIGVVRVYKNNVTTDFKVAGSGVSALIDITIRYTKTTD